MKPWIFITDFDNTMSEKDFYHIIIDGYIGDDAVQYYQDTKAAYDEGARIGVEFLNKVMGWKSFTDQQRDEMLSQVKIDMDSKRFYDFIKERGGDFMVLSAGFDYYIHETLKREGLEGVHVMTNPGVFEAGVFKILPDINSPYHSDIYGIDKGLVLKDFKSKYERVFFMGDSEPDYHAAIHADVVFAKDELYEMMVKNNRPCHHVQSYKEVIALMKDMTI